MQVAENVSGSGFVTIEGLSGGKIVVMTLSNAAKRNPLSRAVMGEMLAHFQAIAQEKSAKVIVLTSTGPAFCAGHDLKELTAARKAEDKGLAFFTETFALCADLMQQMVAQPQPIIAAVEGIATAAGCQLVATTDLAIAGSKAEFCTPGVNIGLFCSTPMVALSRNLSRKAAMEMLLLGELVGAEEAASLGLVNRVVPAGKAKEKAMEWAENIAIKAKSTVRRGKEAFYRQAELPLAGAYHEMVKTMTENMLEEAAREGIDAFLDRRPPVWPGEAV